MLKKLLKLKRDLTPAEVIQSERSKIEGAFSAFTKIRNDIIDSNQKIELAKEETKKRQASLLAQLQQEERVLTSADDEISANLALLEKIEIFCPKK